MMVATVFDSRRPRPNVLAEAMRAANFSADLARVIVAAGGADHLEPARFFANTYPTGSLKNLFPNVCGRLRGAGDEVARKFGLDTPHGGGRSHGLITLCPATRNGLGAPGTEELVDRACLPRGRARISLIPHGLRSLPRWAATMSSRHDMRGVIEGFEAMGREEAAYWLGMAMQGGRNGC